MKADLGLTTPPAIILAWSFPVPAKPDHGSAKQALAGRVITPAYVNYYESMQALAPVIDDNDGVAPHRIDAAPGRHF
jgi:hypothetical protein